MEYKLFLAKVVTLKLHKIDQNFLKYSL